MRLRLAANNYATRRNEIIKSYLQLGSSSNRYAPHLPQQETKSSTKQLAPTDPILGPENLLKTVRVRRKGSRMDGISLDAISVTLRFDFCICWNLADLITVCLERFWKHLNIFGNVRNS